MPAGGTITFTLYKADCTTLATGTGTNPQTVSPVNGDGTYGPVSFTPDAPGTYNWEASYSGDLPNTNRALITLLQRSERGRCGPADPDRDQNEAELDPERHRHDHGHVGNLAAGGTATFKLFANGTCTGDPMYAQRRGPGRQPRRGSKHDATRLQITTHYPDAADSVKGRTRGRSSTRPRGDTAHTGRKSSCETFSITYTNTNGPGTKFPLKRSRVARTREAPLRRGLFVSALAASREGGLIRFLTQKQLLIYILYLISPSFFYILKLKNNTTIVQRANAVGQM